MTAIETVDSQLPPNIDKLEAIEIKQPCQVDRAYQLVEDYPNLKSIWIGGVEYTRQTIKQMPFGQFMGLLRHLLTHERTATEIMVEDPIPEGWITTGNAYGP